MGQHSGLDRKLIIAIDGFSSCGKSTMARALARRLGYVYIDTGAMYRAVSLYCLQNNLIREGKIHESGLKESMPFINISFKNISGGNPHVYLNGKDVEDRIRTMEVSSMVSYVSALPFVRESLVAMQRKAGENGGVVMDGRDIGTVVFPDADLKIFVTADAGIRAKRRFDELTGKGQNVEFDNILKNVEDRDRIDQERKVSPLKKSTDAIVLDNGNMTIKEQNAWLDEQVKKILNGDSGNR